MVSPELKQLGMVSPELIPGTHEWEPQGSSPLGPPGTEILNSWSNRDQARSEVVRFASRCRRDSRLAAGPWS